MSTSAVGNQISSLNLLQLYRARMGTASTSATTITNAVFILGTSILCPSGSLPYSALTGWQHKQFLSNITAISC
jgi:hypothetical protein